MEHARILPSFCLIVFIRGLFSQNCGFESSHLLFIRTPRNRPVGTGNTFVVALIPCLLQYQGLPLLTRPGQTWNEEAFLLIAKKTLQGVGPKIMSECSILDFIRETADIFGSCCGRSGQKLRVTPLLRTFEVRKGKSVRRAYYRGCTL